MARKRITQLTAVTSAADADILHIGQSAADKSMTVANFRGQMFKTAVFYGAAANGSTDDRSAINTALAAVDELRFTSGTYRLASSLTIAEGKRLVFDPGAKLSPDSGQTLTINGLIVAGPQQIFTGSGTVVFGSTSRNKRVFPQWFGAVADGDGAGAGTDDTTAIQKALTAMQSSGKPTKLEMPSGIYNITAGLTAEIPYGLIIEGAGAQVTQIYAKSAFSGNMLKVMGAQLFEIKGLSIVADKKADRCLFLDGDNTPPLSVGRVSLCQFIGAIEEGVMVNNVTSGTEYQGDHIVFDSCNLSQSKYNLVINSGNALENVIFNCQFFGFGDNNPDYNIWFKKGSAKIIKGSAYHAQLYDIRFGPGTYCDIDHFYSESQKIITADTQSFFEYPATIRNFIHNANYNGDAIAWDRNCVLMLENCRFGGSINFGASNILGGAVIGCTFRDGYVFTGDATAYAKLANIRSMSHNGSAASHLGQPFRANAVRVGINGTGGSGNLQFYDDANNGIIEMENGKALIVYDLTAAATRLRVDPNGTTTVSKTLEASGGSAASVSDPAARIPNNRLITFLDSAAGESNCGFVFLNGSNELQLGAGNSTGLKLDASATAGHLRALIYDVNSGQLQRVKVGANDTGPGGTGRALYIDNA